MSKVAEQLRTAREARKLSIPQAADATKIRTDHLRALEDGRYEVFAAPVYIRGFVRAYALLLKLDAERIMADLDQELAGNRKFREPPPLSDQPPKGALDFVMLQLSKLNTRRSQIIFGAVGVLILLLVALVIWHSRRSRDPLADLPPAVYKPAAGSGETLPLPKPAR